MYRSKYSKLARLFLELREIEQQQLPDYDPVGFDEARRDRELEQNEREIDQEFRAIIASLE